MIHTAKFYSNHIVLTDRQADTSITKQTNNIIPKCVKR